MAPRNRHADHLPSHRGHCNAIFVGMLMHVFVVALRAKKASPAQNRGLPIIRRFWTRHARVTTGTQQAVQWWDNSYRNRKGCTEEGRLELSTTHIYGLPTKIALWRQHQHQQKRCCTCSRSYDSMHACMYHEAPETPTSLQIAGSDKKRQNVKVLPTEL